MNVEMVDDDTGDALDPSRKVGKDVANVIQTEETKTHTRLGVRETGLEDYEGAMRRNYAWFWGTAQVRQRATAKTVKAAAALAAAEREMLHGLANDDASSHVGGGTGNSLFRNLLT